MFCLCNNMLTLTGIRIYQASMSDSFFVDEDMMIGKDENYNIERDINTKIGLIIMHLLINNRRTKRKTDRLL